MLTFWIYRALGSLVALLPLRAAILLGRGVGWLSYWIFGGYRRIAMRGIEIAFPERAPHLRRRLARRHFAIMGGNVFAMEKIARMPPARVPGLVEIEGLEIIERLAAEGRGFVFVAGHLGNWELLAQFTPQVFPCKCGTLYQHLGNPHFDAHMRAVRARSGLALFERRDGINGASDLLRAGGGVGILIDQHAGDPGIWSPFFDRLCSTSPLAAMLALRTRAAIVTVTMYTHGVGRWRLCVAGPVEPGTNNVRELTARLNVVVEGLVREQPEDWFWAHNRWKTPRPKFLLAHSRRGIVIPPTATEQQLADADAGELFQFAAKKATWGAGGKLQPFRILIRSSNWLGDAVMTVPAVRAIKRGRPDTHITVLTPAKLADVWHLVPEVDAVIAFEPPPGRGIVRALASVFHVFKVARLVRGRGFEAAVLFPNSLRVAAEAWLARIPRRVGYAGHAPRGILLNQIFRPKKRTKKAAEVGEHQVHHYLRLAEFIGADISGAHDFPAAAITSGPLHIAICPGAEYGPAKRWLPERFAEAIRIIAATRDCRWSIVGTAKDNAVAQEILAALGPVPGVENLCGRTTLAQLIEVLRGSRLLLTNDTGTMHLAALLGVRTVAIFGSTEPALTGPLGEGHTILRKRVECSPCFRRECPIDFPCMTGITAAEVADAVAAQLDQSRKLP